MTTTKDTVTIHSEVDENELVRVYNKGPGFFQHGEYSLGPNSDAEVPLFIAKLWASDHSKNVVLSKPTAAHGAASAKIVQELEKQKQENVDLQKRIENLETLINRFQTGEGSSIAEQLKANPEVNPKRGPGRPSKPQLI